MTDTIPSQASTILLIGSDARPGQATDRSRADALQLVSSDGTGRASIIGVARDSWLPVPGHGSAKINAAMAYGGPDLLVEALSAATVPIEGYLLTSFTEFTELVDLGGGLPVVLKAAVEGSTWASFPAGEQRLGGAKALSLARERKALPDGDFGRSRHQGDLVIGGVRLARAAGPKGLPDLMTMLGGKVRTDLDAEAALVTFARTLRTDPQSIVHEVTSGSTPMRSGQSVVLWDGETERIFDDLADDGVLG